MIWSLIFVCLKSFVANFGKKTFAKLAYLLETLIRVLSAFKLAI